MKKIIALMLAFVMLFAFAACKDNEVDTPDESTTAADVAGDVVEDGTQAPADDSTVAATEEGSTAADETAESTEAEAEDTTAAQTATIEVPGNGSRADIVRFFNQYATAMKNYKGKVTVKRVQGTTSKINKITGGNAVASVAEGLLPNDYPQTETKTFNGGKAADGETLAEFLPADDLKAYNLSPDGVQAATCAKYGDGWKVTIILAPETGTGLQYVPTHHGSCFDTLSLTEEDFKPFEPVSTTVNYMMGSYSFVINPDGTFASITVAEPANVVCKLKMGFAIDADFTGTWKQEYTFTY